jgi:hypothetical protein
MRDDELIAALLAGDEAAFSALVDRLHLDAFTGRLWVMAGYQHELGGRVYGNVRAGVGIHLWRTDHLAEKERKLVPAGDVNLGFRF